MPTRELKIPDGAEAGPAAAEAFEIMRVWWVGDHPEFVLKPALRDPENIGRMLGEAAQHFAQVHASWGDGEAEDLLKKIREGWDRSAEARIVTRMSGPSKDQEPA